MRVPPCKDCTKRCAGCHGKCDEYKAWSDERNYAREWLHNEQTQRYRVDYKPYHGEFNKKI